MVRDGRHGGITVHWVVGKSEDADGEEMEKGDVGSEHGGSA